MGGTALRSRNPNLSSDSTPSPDKWDDWTELDAAAWPERVEKHYALIPTICFNCESACGLVAYVDKESERITKFEGNPVTPGSRGCDRPGPRARGAHGQVRRHSSRVAGQRKVSMSRMRLPPLDRKSVV